jgi:hypothetical protein
MIGIPGREQVEFEFEVKIKVEVKDEIGVIWVWLKGAWALGTGDWLLVSQCLNRVEYPISNVQRIKMMVILITDYRSR